MNKKAVVKWIKSTAAMMIMISIMAALVGFLIIIPKDTRDTILPPLQKDVTADFLEVYPGTLEPGSETEVTRNLNLGNIYIDNTLNTQKELVSPQISLESSVWESEIAKFTFSANADAVKSASLELFVERAAGDGQLTVYINGIPMFSGKVNSGKNMQIRVPLSHIKDDSNAIKLALSPPNWMFWQTNSIEIRDLTFVTEEYSDEGLITQVFTMSSGEVASAEDVVLTAYITKQTVSEQSIELLLNNQRLFRGIPQQNFILELPASSLNGGSNTLTWSVDAGGAYFVRFVTVEFETLDITGDDKEYSFAVTSSDYDEIKDNEKDWKCYLTIEKVSGSNRLDVSINGNKHDYSFSDNTVVDDVCNDLRAGKNYIRLSAPQDIDLDVLRLTITNE